MATQSKQKKVKGGRQKLKLFRSNEPLKSVLMWGVNYSLTQMNHVKPRAVLLTDDFKASIKVKVHNQFFNKENMPSRYKFKEYCPLVFQNLRERFNVKNSDYINAFTKKQPQWGPDKKYLITYDNRYVIEIITSEDVEEVHHLLEAYHEYIVNCYCETLLPRCLAMYRLIVADQIYYMLVTKNTFSPRLSVFKKYQLKGCTVDREASVKEKAKPQPTFKDLDFTNDGCKIEMGPQQRDKTLEMLQKDVEFLQSNNMMSYSLLVGIHDPDQKADEAGEAAVGAGIVSGDEDGPLAGSPGEEDYGEEVDSGGGGGHVSDAGSESEFPPGVTSGLQKQQQQRRAQRSGDDAPISPPDSPGFTTTLYPTFSGDLDPDMEFYGIKCSTSPNVIFFIGLVHIFTRYGMKKRTAKTYKSVRHGHNAAEISTVKPDHYGKRFLEFVASIME